MKIFIVLAIVAIAVRGETQQEEKNKIEDAASTEEVNPKENVASAPTNSEEEEMSEEEKRAKEAQLEKLEESLSLMADIFRQLKEESNKDHSDEEEMTEEEKEELKAQVMALKEQVLLMESAALKNQEEKKNAPTDDAEPTDAGIESKSADADIESKSNDADIESKSNDADIESKSTDADIESKSIEADIESKSNDADIESKSTDADIESKSTEADIESKSNDTDIESKSTEADIESKSTEADIESKSADESVDAASTEELDVEDLGLEDNVASTQTNSESEKNFEEERRRLIRLEVEKAVNGIKEALADKTKYIGTASEKYIYVMDNAVIDITLWLEQNPDAEIEDMLEQQGNFVGIIKSSVSKIQKISAEEDAANASETQTESKSTESKPTEEKPTESKSTSLQPEEAIVPPPANTAHDNKKEKGSIEARRSACKDLENAANGLKNSLADKTQYVGTIAYETVIKMENAADNAIAWLKQEENQDADLEDILEQKRKLLSTVEALVTKISDYTPTDVEARQLARKELENAANSMKKNLRDNPQHADNEHVIALKKAADDAIAWLELKENQDADIKDIEEQKKKFTNAVEAIAKKINESTAPTLPPDNTEHTDAEIKKESSSASAEDLDPEVNVEDLDAEVNVPSDSINSEQPGDKDEKQKERIEARIALKDAANSLKTEFADKNKFAGTTAYEAAVAMENAANDAIKWLEANPNADLEDIVEQRTKLMNTVETLMSKLIQSAGTDKVKPGASESTSQTHTKEDCLNARNELKNTAQSLKKQFVDKSKFAGTSIYEEVMVIEKAAVDVLKWLDKNQDAEYEEIVQQKEKLLDIVQTSMSKLIQTATAEAAGTTKPSVDRDEL